MRNKLKATLFLITSLVALATGEAPLPEGARLLDTQSMNIEVEEVIQKDNTRIYLEEGAIWASRDVNTLDPELRVSAANEAVLGEAGLSAPLSFNVKTNYGYYIKNWNLSIYNGEDLKLRKPIKVIEGENFNNNMSIIWDGILEDSELSKGDQLLFKLTLWDEDGHMDVTSTGVIDVVSEKTNFDLERTEELEDNKRTYGEAELMKHNIPVSSGMVRFKGTHLKGIDKLIVGDEEYNVDSETFYAEKYLPTDKYIIPVLLKYEDGRELEYEIYVEIPEQYYIQTGMADLYVGRNYISKNDNVLGIDDEFDGDVYDRGRLSYFGMAKFNDKLRVTAHLDTREHRIEDMFEDLHKSDQHSIFERVENDDVRFYPTYGDEAYIERVVNTQGKLYLDVMYEKSNYLWGNYNTGITATEFSQYNRSLYGAKADFRTRSTTSYGDDRLNIVAFASEPDSLSAHDEFIGTGGSLYFLQNGDVIDGSEKLAVKLVNSKTNMTEDIVYLREGRDYEIDNYQGRIILTKPLRDLSADHFGSIIQSGPRSGYESYLVADYEYVSFDSDELENLTTGGRAKAWLNDHIGIGGTYVNEEKDALDYEMKGADLTLRATEGTYIIGEFSESQGTQVDNNFVSLDGGLNFTQIDRTNYNDKDGEAYRISGTLSFYDLLPGIFSPHGNDITAWHQYKDANYSYASKDDDLEWNSYGTELRLKPFNRLQLKARYSYLEERDLLDQKASEYEELRVQAEFAATDKLTLGLEGKTSEEFTSNGIAEGDVVGAKIGYDISDDTSVFAKTQTVVDSNDLYENNELYTIGGETKLTEKLRVSAEGSKGDRGYSTDVTADYSFSEDYEVYAGYVLESMKDSSKNNVVLGQKAHLTDRIDVYQENQFVDENNGKGRTESYGFDYEVTEDYKVGLSFQMGHLRKDTGDTRRRAVSLYQKIDYTRFTMKNKVEFRQDKGTETLNQYLTTNDMKYKLSDEYTALGKFNYSRTNNTTTNEKEAEFTEASIGLAYRPIYNDKLNYLVRYTFLQDEETSTRNISYEDERSHIVELETIYELTSRWDIGAKFAYKNKDETITRASGTKLRIESDIYLAGIRATYHLMNNWDIFSEYHWKSDTTEDDLEQGAIVAINRHIGDNLKLGIGYNFSKFDDNLKRDDYDAHGWFINLVGKF